MIRHPVVTLLLLLATASCEPPPPPEWHEAQGYRWRELRVRGRGEAGFTALKPSKTGIDFANALDVEHALDNEHLLIGSGVALGDVDGDGLADIYLNRLQGPNRLYRNLGGWRFEDVTEGAGVAAADRYSTGVAMADIDGDGDLDLVVTSLGGPDVVFRNDGSGRFVESAADLAPGLGSSTVTLADVDGDGDLDLYVTAYKAESASDALRMFERSPSELEAEMVQKRGDSLVVARGYRDHFRIAERGGRRVVVERADPDRLYLNDGAGGFEPVSWTGGAFVDEAGHPLDQRVDHFGLAARFYDVDQDGDPDLYVCNDFDDPDQLWINRGDNTFQAAPRFALRITSHASMSVDFADLDRDGFVDFFVAEMRSRDPDRRLLEVPLRGPRRKPIGVIDDRPQVQRNTLFLSRGDGSFTEIAQLAGVDASDWTWGAMFLDVDLDGLEDLLAANGYSRDILHGDVASRITALGAQASTREMKRLYPEFRNRNVAFRNQGDLTFRDVSEEWGFGALPDISHGIAAGDLDGDGDLDVVINRLGAPALVLRNDAAGGRVAVRLRGKSNTYGVGAKVRLIGGPVRVQEREMTAGGLYLSSSEPQLAFAAGEASSLTIEVDWPSGIRSVIEEVRRNRLYEVTEGSTRWTTGRIVDRYSRDDEYGEEEPPLFSDQSDLLGHRHPEMPFEAFRQLLLPYDPSRLGPGVSWLDVDGDGDPDLVVPPGRGGRLGYLRNDGDRFTDVTLERTPSRFDRTAAVGLPGADGRVILVVGQSNYEAPTIDRVRDVPAALIVEAAATGAAPTPLFPSGLSATGPLALADVDGDGDLDLFLGGRVIKDFYPLPATSHLFVNEHGDLKLDGRNEDVLKDIGLVSAAVFSDIDADGDPDLLLAIEWGPVRLLINEGGRFTDETERWGLDAFQGRWNGITTGDLDGDGRMDVLVTGWGRNVRYRPRPGRPLVLFHGELDGNKVWNLLLTQANQIGQELRPLEPYVLMREALRSLPYRLPTFEAYSEASLEEILGIGARDVFRTVASEYDHLLLLNRDGRFEAVPLPVEAQFAPSMGVTVGDLDGDGREDVFLSQNFFPTSPNESRYDAGLGLFLRGDGAGGLEAIPPARSGIRIYGDQRGAALADYDGDARVDLAVAQNGAATRLYRNEQARPGLRVRLMGTAGNLDGIGSVLRVVYADAIGPAREVHGGSGYWSMDHAVQVLGLRSDPVEVLVRWPGGSETRIPVPPGTREITARMTPR